MTTISQSKKFTTKNIFGVTLIILALLSSCKKKDKEPDQNTTTPAVVCGPGFYGANCDTYFNAAYATSNGTLTEQCSASGAGGPYTVSIVPTPGKPLEFTIARLWEVPAAITTCTINSSNRFIFSAARQPIMTGFDIAIPSGTLSANGASVNLTYQIYATGSTTLVADACTSTIVK